MLAVQNFFGVLARFADIRRAQIFTHARGRHVDLVLADKGRNGFEQSRRNNRAAETPVLPS